MPYFKWWGITLRGEVHKGKMFALSEEQLQTLLFNQDVALTKATRITSRIKRPITEAMKIQFFKQLATLMQSGLLVHDALHIVSQHISHVRFQEIIFDIGEEVKKGLLLSEALGKYNTIFDEVTIAMIDAGQKSGSIAHVAQELARYLDIRNQFRKQMRSGAIMPGITFVFFILITLIIFIGIMPKLIEVFAMSGKPLPPITHMMLRISNFFKSRCIVLVVGIVAVGYIGFKRLYKSKWSLVLSKYTLSIPVISALIKKGELTHFTYTVSLLLDGGIQLVPAIAIAKKVVTHPLLHNIADSVEQHIKAGENLPHAMALQQEWFDQGSIALMRVGQESGAMSEMLRRIASMNEEYVKQLLLFVIKIFQPLLIVIMGLLVSLLLFSVYLPLFNMSEAIAF